MRRLWLGFGLLLVACGGTMMSPTNTPAPVPTATLGVPTTVITVTQVVTVAAPTAAAVTPQGAPTLPPTPAPPPTNTPPPPPTATPAPVLVFTSVQGARPFGTASASIKGPSNTQCTIAYTTPAGTVSAAQGLVPKTTDSSGVASWSWVIGSNTRPGTGHVRVTCGAATAASDITIG